MRKIYLFAGLAAMLLASCSSNDKLESSPTPQQPDVALEEGVVGFDAYTQRSTTRAGQIGLMTLDQLKTSGFGVFGYYTDNNDYEQSRIPDFFYNQEVKWNTTKTQWEYEPIKYWPNEYGDNAISDDNDRVTYFAYAPYVTTSTSGKIDKSQGDSWGITGVSRNSAAGDPLVKYIASFENGKSVDLLWGVCDDTEWQIVNTGSTQHINESVKGLPWKDVQRPQGINQRMRFTFKHALTQLSVNVDASVDDFVSTNNDLAAGTKIYVRQVSFTGVALKGTLNLNNEEPDKALWYDYNGTAELASGEPIVIYDGLKDGKEGTAGAKASNEKTLGMNPDIISNENNTTPGVKAATAANGGKPQPLFDVDPVMLIPTGEDMEVEIVYDVETEDKNLATLLSDGKKNGSSIENRIKKTVSFGEKGLENGKHYTLNLHLGMNSVKLDADVSDWEDSYVVREADLPANMVTIPAQAATADASEVTITGDKQDYYFVVSGLNPGETITAAIQGSTAIDALYTTAAKTVTAGSTPDGTDLKANASGLAYVKIADLENTTVRNLAGKNYVMVQGTTSNLAVKLKIDQKASAYQLKVASVDNNAANDEITLATDYATLAANSWSEGAGDDNGWTSTYTTAKAITVKKNGTALTYAATPSAAGEFGWDGTNKKITVFGNLSAGDVVEVTFNNGEAPAETVVAKIGGLAFVPATRTLYYSATAFDAKEPVKYGNPGTIAWTSGTTATATIGASDGKVTTVAAGTSDIKATGDATNTSGAEWFYTATSKNATYALTVTEQDTKTTFATAAPDAITNQNKASGQNIGAANPATAKGAETDEAVTTTYTYTIETVNGATTDNGKFTVDGTGQLSTVADLDANKTYVIVVKAAATAVATKFNASEATYTITVTTGN